jgi:hypothetical protein
MLSTAKEAAPRLGLAILFGAGLSHSLSITEKDRREGYWRTFPLGIGTAVCLVDDRLVARSVHDAQRFPTTITLRQKALVDVGDVNFEDISVARAQLSDPFSLAPKNEFLH